MRYLHDDPSIVLHQNSPKHLANPKIFPQSERSESELTWALNSGALIPHISYSLTSFKREMYEELL